MNVYCVKTVTAVVIKLLRSCGSRKVFGISVICSFIGGRFAVLYADGTAALFRHSDFADGSITVVADITQTVAVFFIIQRF